MIEAIIYVCVDIIVILTTIAILSNIMDNISIEAAIILATPFLVNTIISLVRGYTLLDSVLFSLLMLFISIVILFLVGVIYFNVIAAVFEDE